MNEKERRPYDRERPARPAPRKPGFTPGRMACAQALLDVEQGGAFAAQALDQRLRQAALDPQDRRFATDLFYGVIEKRLLLDYILSRYMQRPMDDTIGLLSLRMGVYQELFMNSVPDFAACNQQVEMMRLFKRDKLCGIVNGVLRSLSRDKDKLEYPSDPVERLSVLSSTPLWLTRFLCEQRGMERTEALLKTGGRGGGLYIRPNLMRMDDMAFEDFLRAEGVAFERTDVPHIYHVREMRAADPAFRRGDFSVLGQASALAALAVQPKPGMQVLDACAAPGGKTCLMAELMQGTGRVHAFDLHEHRVGLINAYVKRLGLDNVRPRIADARNVVETLTQTMDAVLVDAPCSGLGVLHEKPDIKYRLQEENLRELPQTQLEILLACAEYPKPGGTLVYSTCTVNREENEDVVRAFLERRRDYDLQGLSEALPEAFRGQVKDSMLELWPQDGTEGFFIARMVRRDARP